ncbi:MAG: EpsI family protein [Puniceicoccales bacterium]|nr:EpsI family protein [Puniceicoccales bacterium]
MKKTVLAIEAGVLALTLALAAYIRLFTTAEPELRRPLAELVPAVVPGWNSRELPIAATEVMAEIVGDVLKFDGFAYRLYANPKTRENITVYAAYWKPSKVSTTDAGVHNPDSCWVNSGWKRLERRHALPVSLGGKRLKPVEYGLYSKMIDGREVRLPVYFWHLVGGEPNAYEEQREGFRSGLFGRLDRLPLFLRDLRRYGLNQMREQMFIRLVCDRPIEELARDPAFETLLTALAGLGIFEGTQWGDATTAAGHAAGNGAGTGAAGAPKSRSI